MITKEHRDNCVSIKVFGEFTLADYQEFEELVNYKIKFIGPINLLIDLNDMAGFTVDVAWEDIKFTRQHANDFTKIAIISDDQWISWSAWLSQIFVSAKVQVFKDPGDAQTWIS